MLQGMKAATQAKEKKFFFSYSLTARGSEERKTTACGPQMPCWSFRVQVKPCQLNLSMSRKYVSSLCVKHFLMVLIVAFHPIPVHATQTMNKKN